MSSFHRNLLIGLNITVVFVGAYYISYASGVSEASSLNECLRVRPPLIRWIAGIISAVAVVGIIGAFFKLKVLEGFYLFALLFSTAATILLCLFVWAIMPNVPPIVLMHSTAVSGMWLPLYGKVMQITIANQREWSAVKACFRRIDTCEIMRNQTEELKIVFLDLGCCISPNRCRFDQDSKGNWVVPENGLLNKTDSECQMWARVGKNCFECDSCKAGYLSNFHEQWDKSMPSRILCIVFLIATSALAYYIFMQDYVNSDRPVDDHKFID